ncbi:hypothetical protein IU459_01865 [Nocardia amamiensis]|uniref:Uncharacterized protein n=1 Tax=Nocardia amamiensis TaxID=404578 RepID=A0ABS0CI56_9NOCA|nr:DUF5361 domain-containing protein [Nocardia amamiensis]MBF6296287.1 hypothetical protein [Nocardia amamiensis]
MIALGLRLRQLGSEELSWRDLKAIVRLAPVDSALSRAMRPDDYRWQLNEHLLASMADSLRWLVWSKTTAAQQNRDRPEPIPRPGLKSTTERIGTSVGVGELNRFLGWADRQE